MALPGSLASLLRSQLGVLTNAQALEHGLTRRAVDGRIERHGWSRPLPGVLFTCPTELSFEQQAVAASLWVAEVGGAVDAAAACRLHGFFLLAGRPSVIDVVVPQRAPLRSWGWLRVRRTDHPIPRTVAPGLASVQVTPPVDAAVAAAARLTSPARMTALLGEAVRRTPGQHVLVEALARAPRRRARQLERAAEPLLGGARTLGEARFRALAEGHPGLPPLRYNWLLELPGGLVVSPDAIAPDVPLVHEVNGRDVHYDREGAYTDTQRRSDALVVAGLTVLSNTPERIRDEGHAVIEEFAACHRRLRGQLWPRTIRVLRAGPS